MPRELDADLEAILGDCTEHTTLAITLGNEVTLYLATSQITIDGHLYLGKLKARDALNMELTPAADAMNFELTNIDLETGQLLINTPNVLDGTFAVLGVYFKNLDTNQEWHEEKIVGEIRTGEMDGDVIPLTFVSDIDSAEYNGLAIGTVFPDAQNETQIVVPPVNDIYNGGLGAGNMGGNSYINYKEYDPLVDDFRNDSRYALPEFLV